MVYMRLEPFACYILSVILYTTYFSCALTINNIGLLLFMVTLSGGKLLDWYSTKLIIGKFI